jgi:hypothetical protein
MTINKEELKEIIEEILGNHSHISSEEHSEQHEWITARIQAERDRQAFYREAIKTLMQWSLPVVAGTVWYWLQGHWK